MQVNRRRRRTPGVVAERGKTAQNSPRVNHVQEQENKADGGLKNEPVQYLLRLNVRSFIQRKNRLMAKK